MKHQFVTVKYVTGLSILMVGLLVVAVFAVQVVAAQQNDPPNLGADYTGTDRCKTCHNADEAPLWATWNATLHAQTIRAASEEILLGDFTDTDALTITWPDGQERAVQPSDITYVIGGRYTQQYISVMDREDGEEGYFVLPVTWNIPQTEDQVGIWSTDYTSNWTLPEYDWRVACAGCHTTGWTATGAEVFPYSLITDRQEHDIEIGVNCETCHGPASEHYGGANDLPTLADAQVCAQCHSQGHAPGSDSPFPVGYQPGMAFDENVFILADENDELVWWPSGNARVSNAQYNEWSISAHADALTTLQSSELAEDSCLRCHTAPYDSTDPTPGDDAGDVPWTLETAQYGVTCVTCHNPHPSESDPQEPPRPGIGGDEKRLPADHEALFGADGTKIELLEPFEIDPSSITPYLLQNEDTYELCVSCHNSQTPEGDLLLVGESRHHPVQEMYEGWPVVEGIDASPSGHYLAEDGPGCVDCHMPETAPIGEYGGAASHTLIPAMGNDPGEPNSCTSCHTDLSPRYLQRFVDEIQNDTLDRLSEIQTLLVNQPDVDSWVYDVINFVEGDGSLGVHNVAYTDELLNAVETELGLGDTIADGNGSHTTYVPVQDPTTCAECHRDEMRTWQASPHANASLNDNFLQEFGSQGRPSYCLSCHASGYNAETGDYQFEGVVCGRCHVTTSEGEHPPAPISVADAPALCGQCHSGAHAPTYDEWLVSDHSVAGVDCVDCHTPHDNGLVLGDVNSTCGDCHQSAVTDEIHMGADMTCVDCHLTRRMTEGSVHVLTTGHTMAIDPSVCAECHGNTHLLNAEDFNRSPEEIAEVGELREEITRLEDVASENRYSSIIGGALGMLVLLFVLYLLNRLRRLL